ncbi:Stress responsive A/B Barrel Domain [Pseudarcicella hirudinis]|uniref:Stress responsive A/B Barrel Domain n=1 Tax=Pseudarcicella hirudinis TaxID=1079859 RepID=A0A1I5X377_9BACT|nr:Dabb family protein [Pseudarcicella hirudinis]SFQ26127.1 Stress responsive A/B Barrel Domain [Pseudarcicella hirudinis]
MKNESRRNFVKKSALGLSVAAATSTAASAFSPNEIFVHHVYFWLKNPGSQADKAKLLEGLEKLSKVPTIKMVHIGSPASTNRSVIERSYAVSWLLFFNNIEDEEIYQTHPIHLKFIEDYSHLWEKVIVYDSVGNKR